MPVINPKKNGAKDIQDVMKEVEKIFRDMSKQYIGHKISKSTKNKINKNIMKNIWRIKDANNKQK